MPVYNGGSFLKSAIDSILQQTFRDFELIVIDDGSTDSTPAILRSYGSQLRVQQQANAGIVQALNLGLMLARGQFIARMDADDIAHPMRLEKQVISMQRRPEIGLLGTSLRYMDAAQRSIGISQMPQDDLTIRWTLLLANPFFHPTVMLRRKVLTDHRLNYSDRAEAVEDYDLWVRMLRHTRGANLIEPLVSYRVHPHSVTSQARELMFANHCVTARQALQNQLQAFTISADELRQLMWLTFRIGAPISYTGVQRIKLAEKYLDMFASFARAHAGRPELAAVRREVALRSLRILAGAAFQPQAWPVLRRLFQLDPFWIGRAAGSFPRWLNAQWRNKALFDLRAQPHTLHPGPGVDLDRKH
jgi:hypothetical protein